MQDRFPGPGPQTNLKGRARECALLDGLVAAIRQGESRSLLLRGQAGIGKTALLEYLIESASDLTIVRAVGVESETELAYASLHQLCAPLLNRLERLLEGVWTSREATALKAVPRRLLVLGGGRVGVELAQVVRRLGGEVVLIERSERVLPREAEPLGEAVGEVLRRDGIELFLGADVTVALRDGEDYVLEVADGRELRGDRLLVAAGRHPRVNGIGLETLRMVPDARGIPVDARLRAGGRLWAIGDVTGLWPLTHVGKYLTLLSDGEQVTGAHALGPEAGEWLQQATLGIRARILLDVLRDTIQPFATFSEIYLAALKALHSEIAPTPRVAEAAS